MIPRFGSFKAAPTLPALVLALALPLAALPARSGLDDTDAYRFSLLTIKAHLGTALELLRQDAPFGHHLLEPVQRVHGEIRTELESRGAPFDASIIEQLEAAARSRDPRLAASAIDTATTAINASLARSGPMSPESVLDLTGALMRAAAGRYAQAVEAHSVVDTQAYQAGYGFATVAASLLRRAGNMGEAGQYPRLRDAVSLMRAAWPSVVPPEIANDPATVKQWLANVQEAISALKGTG